MIDYTANLGELTWHGYVYAAALLVSQVLTSVFQTSFEYLTVLTSVKVYSATVGMIFRKVCSLVFYISYFLTFGFIYFGSLIIVKLYYMKFRIPHYSRMHT